MQWYVYLIMIPAIFFLGQVAVELFGQPFQTIWRLRQQALERLLAFRDIKLPRPRETAVSSREIREHDWATQNTRAAQLTFADLGAQLIAFREAEPTIGGLMALCGFDVAAAGRALLDLSQAYAAVRSNSEEAHDAIEAARHAANCALTVSRWRSAGSELTKIRLEPIYLHAPSPRQRKRPAERPRAVPRRTPAPARMAARPMARFGK